ncbi:MAG: hypothetical protein QF464_24095 [Myxococcota bacterium]|nr:hypothetical protein [Myxococcota bacterium]
MNRHNQHLLNDTNWLDILGVLVALAALALALHEGLSSVLQTGALAWVADLAGATGDSGAGALGGQRSGGLLAGVIPFIALMQGHMAKLERACTEEQVGDTVDLHTSDTVQDFALPFMDLDEAPVSVRRRRVVSGRRVWPSTLRRQLPRTDQTQSFDEEAWFEEGLRIARGEPRYMPWTFWR